MRQRVVFLILITLFSFTPSQSANALTVPIEAPSSPTSLVGLLESAIAGLIHDSEAIVASIESTVGGLADGVSNPTANVPNTSPATAYTASAAASATSPQVADDSPVAPANTPNPTPTPVMHSIASQNQPVLAYDTVAGAPPVNIFAIQSALDELAARVQGLSTLLASQQNSAASPVVESQIAALQAAVSSQGYSASASPPLGGGAPNTIAAASNIGQLNGVTITNANLTASEIPALAYLPLGGGSVSGTLSVPTLNASSSLFGTLTATNATTTSLAVTGPSTLAALSFSNPLLNCSTYGNGGKLTTDAFGNVVCAADQGGSGSTVAGANSQINFNAYGSFGASSNFTFATSTNTLTTPNASTTNLTANGYAILGAATSTSLFSSIANFTSAIANTFNVSIANIVGFTATNSTTTNATTTNLYAAAAVISSLTGTSATFSGATTTNLAITGIASSLLKTASDGAIVPAIAGTDYVASNGGNWAGTFGSFAPSYYLDARNLTNFTTPFASALAGTTTDALAQGSTNKYFSTALAQAAISISGLPLTYSGGVIGINQANASQAGFLASSDWTNFNGKLASSSLSAGTGISYSPSTGVIANTGVTSVAASGGSTGLTFSGSPVTTTGTLTLGGTLGIGFGGTGASSTPSFGQLLVGNASGGYTLTATSSLGISGGGGGTWGSITGTLANQTDLQTALNGMLSSSSLASSALVASLVSDETGSGSLVFATTPTFAGTPTFSGGILNYSVNSTSTILNNTPYAWTVATSTSAVPLIDVDSSGSSGAISVGSAYATSTTLLFGAPNQQTVLTFQGTSTIQGAGAGQQITIGAGSDIVNFGVNVGIGTTTPAKPLTIDSTSASGTAIRISNSATGGHIFDLVSTGPGNSGGAGRLDIFDVTSGLARLSVQSGGNIGIGTTTPGSLLSLNGIANFTTATSTFYSTGGLNIEGGCFSINGTCISGSGGGVGLGNANTWTGLQTFGAGLIAQASSTVAGPLTVTGASALSGGLALGSATTTAGNGFNITTGCFSINGTCITGGGGSSYTFSYPLINTSGTISAAEAYPAVPGSSTCSESTGLIW